MPAQSSLRQGVSKSWNGYSVTPTQEFQMDDFRARIEKLSPKRLALLALELQAKLERLQNEPIAIVGMGCRIPGAEPGLDGFWRLLEEGRDAISQVPAE